MATCNTDRANIHHIRRRSFCCHRNVHVKYTTRCPPARSWFRRLSKGSVWRDSYIAYPSATSPARFSSNRGGLTHPLQSMTTSDSSASGSVSKASGASSAAAKIAAARQTCRVKLTYSVLRSVLTARFPPDEDNRCGGGESRVGSRE